MRVLRHLICVSAVLILSCGFTRVDHALADRADAAPVRQGTDSDERWRFIGGVRASEDLILVPGTPWVIVSEGRDPIDPASKTGRLHLLDSRTGAMQPFYPTANTAARARWDKSGYGGCPGPLAENAFNPHGVTVRKGSGGVHQLYVIHHGVRESVEIFELDARGTRPEISWVGCVLMPPGVAGNAVAALPQGFVITQTIFPPPAEAATWAERVDAGLINVGAIYEWTPAEGWRKVDSGVDVMPNGIEASTDGKWLYYSDAATERLIRLSRGETPVRKEWVHTGFHNDNVHWSADGALIVAGQKGKMADLVPCVFRSMEERCANSVVIRVDPDSLKSEVLLDSGSYKRASGAILVEDEIWMGSMRGTTVARYSLRTGSSQ